MIVNDYSILSNLHFSLMSTIAALGAAAIPSAGLFTMVTMPVFSPSSIIPHSGDDSLCTERSDRGYLTNHVRRLATVRTIRLSITDFILWVIGFERRWIVWAIQSERAVRSILPLLFHSIFPFSNWCVREEKRFSRRFNHGFNCERRWWREFRCIKEWVEMSNWLNNEINRHYDHALITLLILRFGNVLPIWTIDLTMERGEFQWQRRVNCQGELTHSIHFPSIYSFLSSAHDIPPLPLLFFPFLLFFNRNRWWSQSWSSIGQASIVSSQWSVSSCLSSILIFFLFKKIVSSLFFLSIPFSIHVLFFFSQIKVES